MSALRVAVVGGSVGGLTAACLLRDAGHDVVVYERSSVELEQRGAGIGFLPETYRYLEQRAGIDPASLSVTTDHIRYLDRSGETIHESRHRYLFSSWTQVYRHLLRQFDRDRYRLDHDLVAFDADADADAVTLTFGNGSTVDADLLIGADGIGSTVRRRLQPEARHRYAGYVAWRGTVPEGELDPGLVERLGDAITYHVTANSHVLVYPIPGVDGGTSAGERLINFVWYRNYLRGGDLADLLTDRTGRRRELSVPLGTVAAHHVAELRAVAGARLPADVASVVRSVAEPFVQVVSDIEVDRMVDGRVVLLGDAAFGVRPHAAAGTAKAAEDGWALAEALETHAGVAPALEWWENRQLDLGRNLLARTREIGRRSQFDQDWDPSDPFLIFGLHRPGG